MQRIFTKSIGNFKKGDIKDYPQGTWNRVEESADKPLNEFTKPVSDAAKFGIDIESVDSNAEAEQTSKTPRQLRRVAS